MVCFCFFLKKLCCIQLIEAIDSGADTSQIIALQQQIDSLRRKDPVATPYTPESFNIGTPNSRFEDEHPSQKPQKPVKEQKEAVRTDITLSDFQVNSLELGNWV